MARYANSCPHALLPIALSRTMGIAIKNERQSKEGSADIRYQDALYVSDEVLST